MFRFTQKQSSGSQSQCLAKITNVVPLFLSMWTLSVLWRHTPTSCARVWFPVQEDPVDLPARGTTHTHNRLGYTVRKLHKETDFILTKIEMLQGGSNMTGTDFCVNKPHMSRSYLNHLVSMKQCMPSMWPTFICNLATPQRPTLNMTGNKAPCCAGSERTWSQ